MNFLKMTTEIAKSFLTKLHFLMIAISRISVLPVKLLHIYLVFCFVFLLFIPYWEGLRMLALPLKLLGQL
jgi:hypothetical protein